ncbi:hypothetical protein MA16_Dca007382 [Dendrobium catenatum]|uniref:Uncharacterized protein n=1 Tax=Dendrobium catenatum TaxID=906689 RepID=A0A2I0W8M1_9ASPA|nr:hypothetical protein MA16_Dca007382 [Dendrobium catenatum]
MMARGEGWWADGVRPVARWSASGGKAAGDLGSKGRRQAGWGRVLQAKEFRLSSLEVEEEEIGGEEKKTKDHKSQYFIH